MCNVIESPGKSERPISIPALEDKVVQAATVQLLQAIYEVDFLDCSYGSRPGRSAHQALDALDRVLFRESITSVLELDIKSYFDSIVRKHLAEMIERRVSDGSLLRLIGKWINVGVIEEGRSSMRRCQSALALGYIIIAEEPAALIGHGGVCEGGGSHHE